jgi:methionyl-tRNA formyltransferase
MGEHGDPLPPSLKNWEGEYIISFLSPWILPESLLKKAEKAAINFHPGPPEYPGIGCYNFALYDEVKEYGVTCHNMAPYVDTGNIIDVMRFPLFKNDTVQSLKERTMNYLLTQFFKICSFIIQGQNLPISKEKWMRDPYTRIELNTLCQITLDMDVLEVKKRIHATDFPGYPGAYLEYNGYSFYYASENNN